MIERNDLSKLIKWKTRKHRKPLVIRGARQVGKTELVRMLGRTFDHFVEINFDETPEKAGLFRSKDVLEGLRFLAADIGEQIVPGRSLLFLDEIQAVPDMLPLLRYFYEKVPELHVIAAGSLLEFLLSEHDFSMPVGRVEYHFIGPLSFEEFLGASGANQLVELLQTTKVDIEVPELIHDKCMRYLQYYSVIGGMPEAVDVWTEEESITNVQRIHAGILQTYEDDFNKYQKRINPDILRLVFKRIPSLAGRKLRYVNLDRTVTPSSLASAIRALSKAGVITQVFHSDGNGVPLGAEVSGKNYKPLFLDIGLYSTALGLRLSDIHLSETFLMINRGALAEQFIGQHLLYSSPSWIKPELYYWNRNKKGSSSEVDYLVCKGPNIVPVEVKAGKTGTLRSLHTFAALKGIKLALRFNADRPSVTNIETDVLSIGTAQYRLISLPLYMVEQANRILENEVE